MKKSHLLGVVCACLISLITLSTHAVTIDSAYVDHYRFAEIDAVPGDGVSRLNDVATKDQTYSVFEPDFFAASTRASAFTNPGGISVSAEAAGWLRYRQESNPNDYTLDGRATLLLADGRTDFNTSAYGQNIFNQWFDFTCPVNESCIASTSLTTQLSNPDYVIDYFMETTLFVVDTGEVIFSGTTDDFTNSQFSLNQYRGQTLRFQTTGEIEAFMPQNIDTQNSFGWYTIESRLYLQSVPAPVPVPSAIWLFGSGLIGLIGIARKKKA